MAKSGPPQPIKLTLDVYTQDTEFFYCNTVLGMEYHENLWSVFWSTSGHKISSTKTTPILVYLYTRRL